VETEPAKTSARATIVQRVQNARLFVVTLLEAHLPVWSGAIRLAKRCDLIDRAAALALFAMLAAVPAMFGGFSVLGFIFDRVDEVAHLEEYGVSTHHGVIVKVSHFIKEALPGVTWDPSKLAATLVEHRAVNGVFGTLTAIILGMTVFSRLDAGVRALFARRRRSAWRSAGMMSLIFLLGSLLVMLLSVATPLTEWSMGVAANSVSTLSLGHLDGLLLIVSVTQILPIALGFYILVRWSSGRGQSSRRRLVGVALVYGLSWFAGQRLFSMYVNEIIEMDAIYGALTGVVALMLWLYYATLAFLFCVAVLASWETVVKTRTKGKQDPAPPADGEVTAPPRSVSHSPERNVSPGAGASQTGT
jgi:uncharacterized BrkB/YihY/UPF0761 family membrane protein